MPVVSVADFVAKNAVGLVVAQFFEQPIGEDDAAGPRNDAENHGVGKGSTRVPVINLGETKAEPVGIRLQPIADPAGWQRPQTEQ